MQFPETLFTALFSAGIGGSVGCGAAIIAAAVRRRRCSGRVSALCVLLSIAVAAAAALLVFTPFRIFRLPDTRTVIWCASFCAAGFVASLFYRAALPAGAVLYAAASLYVYIVYSASFEVIPRSLPVTVGSAGAVSGSTVLESHSGSGAEDDTVSLQLCTLPPELLFPLPRTWYALESRPLSAPLFAQYLFSGVHAVSIPVPEGLSSPAVYTLVFRSPSGSVAPVLRRIL